MQSLRYLLMSDSNFSGWNSMLLVVLWMIITSQRRSPWLCLVSILKHGIFLKICSKAFLNLNANIFLTLQHRFWVISYIISKQAPNKKIHFYLLILLWPSWWQLSSSPFPPELFLPNSINLAYLFNELEMCDCLFTSLYRLSWKLGILLTSLFMLHRWWNNEVSHWRLHMHTHTHALKNMSWYQSKGNIFVLNVYIYIIAEMFTCYYWKLFFVRCACRWKWTKSSVIHLLFCYICMTQ